MNSISPILQNRSSPVRVAIFLSGSGSNAENLIRKWQESGTWGLFKVIFFTDRPEKSNARALAKTYDVELLENDIKKFYLDKGVNAVSISTPQGFAIREEWTTSVRTQLEPYHIDFGIFAGFIPLTNLTSYFPCLNIHPGDLTYLKQEERYLIGLHTVPIERAILEGLNYLRSSVILAKPYNEIEKKMDDGFLLGISDKVDLDLNGTPLSRFRDIAKRRPPKRPRKGFQDELEHVAALNQDRLKKFGDWILFPKVIEEFVLGNYGLSETKELFFQDQGKWIPLKTIVFGKNSKQIIQAE